MVTLLGASTVEDIIHCIERGDDINNVLGNYSDSEGEDLGNWLLGDQMEPDENEQQNPVFIAPLLYHCKKNHIDIVCTLIEKGCDINVTNYYGENVLYIACYHDHSELLKKLLQYESFRDFDKMGGFILACAKGFTDIFDIFVEYGVDINFLDNGGETPLSVACFCNQLDIIDRLLRIGVDVNILNWMDESAIFNCTSSDSFNRLYVHGANIHMRNKKGQTLLNIYVLNRRPYQLIADAINYGVDVNAVNSHNQTALFPLIKLYSRDLNISRLLIESGVNKTIKDEWGQTALDYAITLGDQEFITLFS